MAKKFQVYVISGDKKTFTNIGGPIVAKSPRAAIVKQKQHYSAPTTMGRVTWRAQEIK